MSLACSYAKHTLKHCGLCLLLSRLSFTQLLLLLSKVPRWAGFSAGYLEDVASQLSYWRLGLGVRMRVGVGSFDLSHTIRNLFSGSPSSKTMFLSPFISRRSINERSKSGCLWVVFELGLRAGFRVGSMIRVLRCFLTVSCPQSEPHSSTRC